MTNLSVFHAQYQGHQVRITPDGKVSVFDAIVAFRSNPGNPRRVWKDLSERHPEVVRLTDSFQFPGRGQQPTPVTDEEGLYQILMLLPGANAAEFRKWAASILTRYRQGDMTLADEITQRASSAGNSTSSTHDRQLLSVQDQLAVLSYVFDGFIHAGVDRKLVESAKIGAIAAQFPTMTPALESAKHALMLQTPDSGRRYNPTELGKMLAAQLGREKPIRAADINQALKQARLQVSEHHTNAKGEKKTTWHLTPDGEKYGRVFLESAQGNSKTIPVIRWLPTVLEAIAPQFTD